MISIKMITVKKTSAVRFSCFAAFAALAIAYLASSEELKNVWHYDLGVTRIGPISEFLDGGGRDSPLNGNTSMRPQADDKMGNLTRKTVGPDDHDRRRAGEDVCNFHGRHLRVAVSPQPPFVNCLQDLHGDWLCNGSNIELIHVLEHRFNFKADWVVLANNHMDEDVVAIGRRPARTRQQKQSAQTIGSGGELNTSIKLPKQSGIFSMVSSGRVLMSANGVMKTIDRSGQKLIVSAPFDSFRLHFLLSKSVRDHDHIFIKPFDTNAWLAILCSAALIVPIFYFINTTTTYYYALDDGHLNRVSIKQCWDHMSQVMSEQLVSRFYQTNRSGSMTSTDMLLENEIGKIMELQAMDIKIKKPPPPGAIGTIESAYETSCLAIRVPPPPPPPPLPLHGESKRRRRLMRHRWALERRKATKLSKLKRKSGFFNVAYVIWYVVASLANQGGETEDLPRADSTRILIAFWWLYMIVICAIHSGILTAILTFPKQNDFIQTLDDYLNLKPSERATLHLTVDRYGELAQLLSNADNLHKSPLQELQKQHVPISYVNFQRHRQRVLDEVQLGQSAFIEERSFVSQIITHEYYDSKQTKCLFKSSRYPIDVIPMSLILSDRMPPVCVESINALLRRIMKTGLAQKWRRKYESLGNDCLNTVVINAGDVDKIELKHVVLAFWLLAFGACVGLLFLTLEIVWLFTIDDEDDDEEEDCDEDRSNISLSSLESSTSTSSSSLITTTSNESDRVKLGFRRALMPTRNQLKTIRSLRAKHLPIKAILRKTKRNQKRTSVNTPRITFELGESDEERRGGGGGGQRSKIVLVVDEKEGLEEVREFYTQRHREKRQKRSVKEAQKRAKRVKRTVDLVKKIHDGKMYSVRVKNRIRRMSHSIANHLQHRRHSAITVAYAGHIARRRRSSVRDAQLFASGRVVPM